MSADQPLTGDELAAIKTRAEAEAMTGGFFGADPRDTLRLVAMIERLQEEADERSKRFARAWLAVAHAEDRSVAIDGATWIPADGIRAALGGTG